MRSPRKKHGDPERARAAFLEAIENKIRLNDNLNILIKADAGNYDEWYEAKKNDVKGLEG